MEELQQLQHNTFIYISIGSKLNETFDADNNNFSTNSAFQMLPYFIAMKQTSQQQPTCCIIIDLFNNQQEIDYNKQCIHTCYHTLDLDITNIQFVFVNASVFDVFESIILVLTTCLPILDSSNCMVCNYVKFKCPLKPINALEQQVSQTIAHALTKHQMSNCFYEWCGYTPYLLYHCIVKHSLKTPLTIAIQLNPLLKPHLHNPDKIYTLKASDFKNIKQSDVFNNVYVIKPSKLHHFYLGVFELDCPQKYSVKDFANEDVLYG